MDDCCHAKEDELASLTASHGRTLRTVLAVNIIFFLIEFLAGLLAHSTSLLADSLDMLGDSLVYGLSLYVLARSSRWKVSASIAKGGIMLAFGIGVFMEAIYKISIGQIPAYETIGIIGGLALAANTFCFFLLYSHRADNLNMRSTWLCSRNDVIANLAVLLAAAGVYYSGSLWPDVIIGGAIALLFLKSASTVLRESLVELRSIRALESPS
jgi:cation diffusion facilitator family transporter